VKLWDPATGVMLASHDPRSVTVSTVRTVAFAPDGRTLYYGVGGHIGRLDVASRSPLDPLPGTFQVAASPDGRTLAFGTLQKKVLGLELREVDLWDLASGHRARLRGHTGELYKMAFAPDGRTLATANWDGTVRLWHAATGEELMTCRRQRSTVWTVAFPPNGWYMVIGAGQRGSDELTLWDARPPEADVASASTD
jgi:WD40 repeat protein